MEPINGSEKQGDCESCENKDTKLTKCGSIWYCDSCKQKDIDAAIAYQAPELQEERLQAHRNVENVHLEHIRNENASLRINTDIFNAKIKSINELKEGIDADASIPDNQKHFVLAQVLGERFNKLNDLLHGLRQQTGDAENEQRAIQTYYNELSKKLREEERAKIRLADTKYKPEVRVEKPKPEPKKLNWDKTGVIVAAKASNLPEAVIQMMCMTKNITPAAAVMLILEAGVKAKSKE